MEVRHRNHESPPPAPIVSQINPVHAYQSYYLKINVNNIFPSTPVLPNVLFPSGLRNQTI